MSRHLGAILFVSTLSASFAWAAPIPAFDLEVLVDQSDLIVVGSVSSITLLGHSVIDTSSGAVRARELRAEVANGAILKGTAEQRPIQFVFVEPDEAVGYGSVSPNVYRTFFLKREQNALVLTSPYYPSAVAQPGHANRGGDALDRVIAVLEHAIRAPVSDPRGKEEAIRALWKVQRSSAVNAVRFALADSNQDIRLLATAALLAANDIDALQLAEDALLAPQAAVSDASLQGLRIGLAEGVADERAVPSLQRLLQASNVDTRRAAALALRHTRSDAAVPCLLKALDDPDFEVRVSAVRALADITGQGPLPSGDAFWANEAAFIDFWKAWARARQR